MAELFGDYKRPNAEKKVIEKYIKIYENSKIFYKNKNYLQTLEGAKNAYNFYQIYGSIPKNNNFISYDEKQFLYQII